MMTLTERKAFVSRHRELLREYHPDKISVCDTSLVWGQSNAGATQENTTDVVVTDPGVAFTILRSPQPRYGLQGPLQNGASNSTFIGRSAPWPAFAQEWFEQTGRKSIVSSTAFAGTPLHPQGLPDQSRHWATTPYATSMVGGSEFAEDKARDEIIDDAVQVVDLHPRYDRGLTIGIWVGGEADGPRLFNGFLTQQQFEDEFHLMIDKAKASWGMDYMFVYALGREGTTSLEVDDKETTQGMAAVRQAHYNVVNARSDTFLVFDGAKEKGSPFNTLVIDGSGYWVSGFEYLVDGVHFTPPSYKTMGKTGARNAAIALGLQI